MSEEATGHAAARHELHGRLHDGLASSGLTTTQVAARSGLAGATVSEALRPDGPPPSAQTVAALAQALGLPVHELLHLQAIAAAPAATTAGDGPALGRPIEAWEPHALEVHPAGSAANGHEAAAPEVRLLSGYVHREHDRVLADAVREAGQGHSRMLVLVGASSTGKTRACWEAVQPLAHTGWRLWHPFDPTRAEAALEDLSRVQPRTVVWLNEAQHYLEGHNAGERIAAALHNLLTDPARGPVLVLGTLWPDYARKYTALPSYNGSDSHSRVRELLAARTLTVPDTFDAAALQRAKTLANDGDRLLADALTRAEGDGRVTQDLAGAPQLLHRYQHGTPAARALLEAAMDARRLGLGLHLPQPFLTDAAADYLSDTDYDQLTDDWAEAAYAELAHPVHGKQAPLHRINPRPERRPPHTPPAPTSTGPGVPVFRLADYLEQYGRTVRRRRCPPASFWHAGHTHLTQIDDLNALADAARRRHRLQWAHHLTSRAADGGDPDALVYLSRFTERSGHHEAAESLAAQAAQAGDTRALTQLARAREKAGHTERAEALARQAAATGDSRALLRLAQVRQQLGNREGAELLVREAATTGSTEALLELMRIRHQAGDTQGAEKAARKAAAGSEQALIHLVRIWHTDGRTQQAEALARHAATTGHTHALGDLALMREKAGDQQQAEALALHALTLGNPTALTELVWLREQAAHHTAAQTFARHAAAAGHTDVLVQLALHRETAGDPQSAEALARTPLHPPHPPSTSSDQPHAGARARPAGDTPAGQPTPAPAPVTDAVTALARHRERAGDDQGAQALYQQAADAGDTTALTPLARIRTRAGQLAEAEALARQAAAAGDTRALTHLARTHQRHGQYEAAALLFQQAIDAGSRTAHTDLARLRDKTGDRTGAETLVLDAAHHGDLDPLRELVRTRHTTGDRTGAETLAVRAAHAGTIHALLDLAAAQKQAGNHTTAEALLRRAADSGNAHALLQLARTRDEAGDHTTAHTLALHAADTGSPENISHSNTFRTYARHRWPHGLNPNGTPTPPWT
ncbi:helix-turn-helix domain-containing protein [Streptomyces sp. NBC_01613]|uniref:hypothetical protein n=1 Tax=Streptomyces sp. NBC_01613 TaxID=2975896 RepID=UPI00386D7728